MSRISPGPNLRRLSILAATVVAAVVVIWAIRKPLAATTYYSDVSLDCREAPVSEGDSFRMYIESNEKGARPYMTFKVHWTTSEGTAVEADYGVLTHEGQASNGFQARTQRMGRTFYTKEDFHSESTETYSILATNPAYSGKVDGNEDGSSCTIEIVNDDGPGAYET